MQELSLAMQTALRHHQAGRLAEAEAIYRQVLDADPQHPDALHLLGLVRRRLGDASAARELISRAVALKPNVFAYRNNLGLVLLDGGLAEKAEAQFRAALHLKPQAVEATVNLGSSLRALGRLEDAAAAFRRALTLNSNLVEAHNNLGNVLGDLGRIREAAACYATAIAIRPDYAEASNNLGALLKAEDRDEEAAECLRRALAADPRNADARCNLAGVLHEQGRDDEALACYREILAQRPDDTVARWAMAMAEIPLVYTDEAEVSRARTVFGDALTQLEDWISDDRLADGERAVGSSQPYYLAYQPGNNVDLLSRYGRLCGRIMQRWQDQRGIALRADVGDGGGNSAGRIRVGIVSAQIREHSVWRALTRGWLRHLDRARFEVQVFHLGAQSDDETTLAASLAHAMFGGPRSLVQWVDAIAAARPDVLIYPEIGMDPLTVKLANLRLAPTQLAAWGHAETTGLPSIDGYLSAALFEAEGAQSAYSERLIALPNLGCCYEPLAVEPTPPDLAALGLHDAKLLLCPGTPYKYLPQHDRIWVDIARALPDCRLVYFRHRKQALSQKLEQRLQGAFAVAGLRMEDHLAFIPWQNRAAYYGLMQRAWLCLDTLGFSGFNTAMQAVECGVPMVTLEGGFMRGRFASAILRRIGIDDLVARDEDDYIARVVDIAHSADRRNSIAAQIEAKRDVLFGDIVPIRALEEELVRLAGARHV